MRKAKTVLPFGFYVPIAAEDGDFFVLYCAFLWQFRSFEIAIGLRVLGLGDGGSGAAGLTARARFRSIYWLRPMVWFRQKKESRRFYLLPGMGGRSLRRKRKLILQWSIVTGLFTAAVVGLLLYWMSNHRP